MVSCKCSIYHSTSQRSSDWGDPTKFDLPSSYVKTNNNGDPLKADFYGMFTGRAPLLTTYVRTYRPSDVTQFVQEETDYLYNVNNFEVSRITVKKSNGEQNSKNITYPLDYFNTQNVALQKLQQNNILVLPVSTLSTVYRPSISTSFDLGEKVTEFALVANGDIRPGRILEQRFTQPSSTAIAYSPDNVNNPSIYKVPQVFTYDVNSNLVGVRDEGGRSITNIYDYSDKYIVASVINANPNIDKCAYSSFESQDLSRSGWVLSGVASYNTNTPSPTGQANFALLSHSGNSLTASSLNAARPYLLSFWSSNANVSVSAGATLTKSAPTISGFTYYEYNIAQGTTTITLSNTTAANASIDELRLYPATARMQTTTYDPIIGKTSECDQNNRIVYYTYDNLARLQFVEDENRYIVKTYEYNNVSAAKQNGCPTSYANPLISEMFVRSNCGAGFLGGNYPYSVPANRYTSSTSQWDADLQAELDLLTNGPTAANLNGSCSMIFFNALQSQTDSSTSCPVGQVGGLVTYTVPANRYSSIISQADANQQALVDITANAQAYANSPDHMSCSTTTAADWTSSEGVQSYCQNVGGSTHMFVFETDLNPHSATFNHTRWADVGPQPACPLEPTIYARLTYENAVILSDGSEIADVVVRFFSDAGCTTPYSVTNLLLNYQSVDECTNVTGTGSPIVNGNNYIIAGSYHVSYPVAGCDPNTQICQLCNVSFTLTAGGYVIR
jgi:Family of unknown function (DUF5977)